MTRATLALIIALSAAACTDEPCADGDCATRVLVARDISFAIAEDGVSEGFDLDGIASVGDDRESCFQEDYLAPDGREGIDNQFAVLWEAIVDVIDDAAEGLIRGAINDGGLLFMIEMTGIDDPMHDDCVDVSIFLGAGQPDIGTDGFITSGQTFDVAPGTPVTNISCARVRDGIITIGPFDGTIPVSILDVSFDLRVHGAMVSGSLMSDDTFYAHMGAGVEAEQIIEVGEGADYRLEGLVSTLVNNRADLARDDELGECTQISATLIYDGVSAFLYEDPGQ